MEMVKFNEGSISFEITMINLLEIEMNGNKEYLDTEDAKLLVKFLNKYIEKNDD